MTRSVAEMTLCAALCAVLCVVCPFSVPAGAVPVTLAAFAVMTVAASAGLKRGLLAVGLYLLIGAVGIPVFAGFSGGFHAFVGPTGGFLFGYLPLATLAGFVSDKTDSRKALLAAFCGGTLLLYVCGCGWYALSMRVSPASAFAVCVLPFFAFDVVKIGVATALAPRLRKTVQSML